LAGFERFRLDVRGLELDPSMLKYLSARVISLADLPLHANNLHIDMLTAHSPRCALTGPTAIRPGASWRGGNRNSWAPPSPNRRPQGTGVACASRLTSVWTGRSQHPAHGGGLATFPRRNGIRGDHSRQTCGYEKARTGNTAKKHRSCLCRSRTSRPTTDGEHDPCHNRFGPTIICAVFMKS
jgi:hypothetical protein